MIIIKPLRNNQVDLLQDINRYRVNNIKTNFFIVFSLYEYRLFFWNVFSVVQMRLLLFPRHYDTQGCDYWNNKGRCYVCVPEESKFSDLLSDLTLAVGSILTLKMFP